MSIFKKLCVLFLFTVFAFPVMAEGTADNKEPEKYYQPGDEFQDCPECPVMKVIPAGRFKMGNPFTIININGIKGDTKGEQPPHTVTIPKPIAVGKFEVTFDEWELCVKDGVCPEEKDMEFQEYRYKKTDKMDNGWGRGKRPVINVQSTEVSKYLSWLSTKTGKNYRPLSESEWEYAARGGATTRYWWGDEPDRQYENFGPISKEEKDKKIRTGGPDKWEYTAPVGSFKPNPFGLYDMLGNVSEGVNKDYEASSLEGEAKKDKPSILRGGNLYSDPVRLRISSRKGGNLGLRVARDIDLPSDYVPLVPLSREEAVFKNDLPSGEEGIEKLVKDGVLIPAKREDFVKWAEFRGMSIKHFDLDSCINRRYIIQKDTYLPKKISKYCFIIPENVPFPKSEESYLLRNLFLKVNDEKIYGDILIYGYPCFRKKCKEFFLAD